MSNYIYWLVAGVVMVLLEFVIPSFVIIFFGIGALITALAVYLGLIESISSQILFFGVSSTTLFFVLRRQVSNLFLGFSTKGDAAKVEDEFTGKEVKVLTAFAEGQIGKVEFKGASWSARSNKSFSVDDIAVIESRDGLTLILKSK